MKQLSGSPSWRGSTVSAVVCVWGGETAFKPNEGWVGCRAAARRAPRAPQLSRPLPPLRHTPRGTRRPTSERPGRPQEPGGGEVAHDRQRPRLRLKGKGRRWRGLFLKRGGWAGWCWCSRGGEGVAAWPHGARVRRMEPRAARTNRRGADAPTCFVTADHSAAVRSVRDAAATITAAARRRRAAGMGAHVAVGALRTLCAALRPWQPACGISCELLARCCCCFLLAGHRRVGI